MKTKLTQNEMLALCEILAQQTVMVLNMETLQDWMDFKRDYRDYQIRDVKRFPRHALCRVPEELALRLARHITMGSLKNEQQTTFLRDTILPLLKQPEA